MNALRWQIRNVIGDIILWALVAASLIVNITLCLPDLHSIEDYQVFGSIVAEFGQAVTTETVDSMNQAFQAELTAAKEIYCERYGIETDSLDALYNMGILKEAQYKRLLLMEPMILWGRALLSTEASFDMAEFADSRAYIFSGQVEAARIREQAIQESGENRWYTVAAFFPHARETLYGRILPALILEMAVIAVYIMLRTLESDYVYQTAALIFTSKLGRKDRLIKILSGLIMNTFLFVILSGLTFAVYLSLFPQVPSLFVPVAAQVYPSFLPKVNMNGLTHLIACLTAGFGIVQIAAIFAGIFGLWFCKSHYALLALGGILGVIVLAWWLRTGEMTYTNLALAWNPLGMLAKTKSGNIMSFRIGEWFFYTSDCLSPPLFEIGTIFTWLVISAFLLYGVWQYFRRKELLL